MALKAQSLTITYTAFDMANSVGKTGDAGNHTLNVTVDGTTAGATNSPAEVSNGEYKIVLTADEMNGDFIAVSGSSSTDDIIIVPVRIATYEKTGYTASTVIDKTGYTATVIDKTGFKLASDGLDSISTTEPSGLASNFREKMLQLYRRFFGKATQTATTLITYKEDGTTPATTQTVSDVSGTETQGEAS